MRYAPAAIASFFLACLPTVAPAQENQISALSWLAGCWASESGEPGSGEHWMPPAGGTMLGAARTVRGGNTVEHEFLQIRQDSAGKLVYVALPSRQKETTFTATSVAENSVTFENAQHDFPQRVIYKALPGDRLAARIEGLRNGALRGIDFNMKRTPCESLVSK
jgi:hypothetical protein